MAASLNNQSASWPEYRSDYIDQTPIDKKHKHGLQWTKESIDNDLKISMFVLKLINSI